MKVLEKGREQRGWSKECRCTGAGNGGGGCNALLLVESPDLYQTSKHDYGGGSDYFVTFSCAACGVATDVDDAPVRAQSLPRKPKGMPTNG